MACSVPGLHSGAAKGEPKQGDREIGMDRSHTGEIETGDPIRDCWYVVSGIAPIARLHKVVSVEGFSSVGDPGDYRRTLLL